MRSALQLRALVRTCEARLEHLSAAIRSTDYTAPFGCQARLEQAHADLAIYRAEQVRFFGHSPVAPSLATAALSGASVQQAPLPTT